MLRQRCAELGADYFFHKATEFEKTLEVCQELATRQLTMAAAVKAPDATPNCE